MIKVAIAAALLALGTSLAMAQNGQPTGAYPPVAGGANGNPARPGINETTAPQTAGHIYMSARHRHKMVRRHYAQ
jgi:hypothetical protein